MEKVIIISFFKRTSRIHPGEGSRGKEGGRSITLFAVTLLMNRSLVLKI
jgi:hypothetical protein